jgi:ketosteroid isomerase-like protein
MVRFSWFVVFVICVLACSTATPLEAKCTSADEKEITDLRASWVTNWNAKKLDDIMKLYAPEATLTPPDGKLISGQDAIKAYFATKIGSTISVDPKPLDCSGDTARDTGTYTEDVKGGGTVIGGNAKMGGNVKVGGGGGTHTEGKYHVTLRRHVAGATLLNGASISNGASMVGGRVEWLIEEQVDTNAKP